MGTRNVMRGLLAGISAFSLSAALALATSGGHGAQPTVLAEFVSGQEIPESVTTDTAGNLYVSVGNTIRWRSPGGTFSVFGTLPLPINALGVKVGPDGCVYTASTSLSAVPGAFVWKLCGVGSVEVFAELDQTGGPNDLAFDGAGNLFVTDPVLARVWKIDAAGNPEVFAEHPRLAGDPANPVLVFRAVGVNGIAFDRKKRFLYVSNTDRGTVLRLRVRGSNHTPALFTASPRLRGADGIAFDRGGRLLVSVNAQDSLISINRQGRLRLLAHGGLLDGPSSVVFGATPSDRHTLYLTSSAFSRTLGFQPGAPHPALLTFSVGTPGLGLP